MRVVSKYHIKRGKGAGSRGSNTIPDHREGNIKAGKGVVVRINGSS